jgi:hypothetical protein
LEEVSALKTRIEQQLSDSVVEQLSTTLEKKFWLRNGKLERCHPLPFHFISFHSIPTLSFFESLHCGVSLRSATDSVAVMIESSIKSPPQLSIFESERLSLFTSQLCLQSLSSSPNKRS